MSLNNSHAAVESIWIYCLVSDNQPWKDPLPTDYGAFFFPKCQKIYEESKLWDAMSVSVLWQGLGFRFANEDKQPNGFGNLYFMVT